MKKLFIHKVKTAILENMEDHNFGVSELASELSLSNSQLLRKVKKATGKSVNSLIREIRLEKALVLIREDELTAAEIAYKVGFNSPSYFSKCFHEYFGHTTGEIKMQDEESFELNRSHQEAVKPLDKINRKSLLIGVSILLIIISFVFTNNAKNQKTNAQIVTIGILPFKNLSGDPSNQNFVDGTMDLILSQLSNIEGLKGVSRTTMEQFSITTKRTPEIAKELNISYLLEATVQKYRDEVRFTVHLIDAKNDQPIWSDDFQGVLENVFLLQSDIAKDITLGVKLALFPNEFVKRDTIYVKNIEAYNLYKKGRFFWHRRTKEDLKKSIFYFEQAIKLDSSYALAYAGLSDAYSIMAWWKWYPQEEGYLKGMEYALKSLSIDPTISEAYATLGHISYQYEWNFDKSEKNLKHAIFLNPEYATARQYYAELLHVSGRLKEASDQINQAINLNPNSSIMYLISSSIYYDNREFEKAIEVHRKGLEINNKKSSLLIFTSYLHLGKNKDAIEELKVLLPDSLRIDKELIDEINQNSGIESVINWVINQDIIDDGWSKFCLFALIGDIDNVIEYMEKYPSTIYGVRINPDFDEIKKEPKFRAYLNLINEKQF